MLMLSGYVAYLQVWVRVWDVRPLHDEGLVVGEGHKVHSNGARVAHNGP